MPRKKIVGNNPPIIKPEMENFIVNAKTLKEMAHMSLAE